MFRISTIDAVELIDISMLDEHLMAIHGMPFCAAVYGTSFTTELSCIFDTLLLF